MKKLQIEKFGTLGRERLGHWECGGKPIQSPGLWLTTSSCNVPHLTPETLEMSGTKNFFSGILLSYEKHARSVDVYEAYSQGFAKFCHFQDMPTLLTILDPMVPRKPGFSTIKDISVWGQHHQRERVDHHHYLKGIAALKPDAYVSLCDSDMGNSAKRMQKALKFTHDCIDLMQTYIDDDNVHSPMIGALEGGLDKNVREKEAKLLDKLPISKKSKLI